MTDDWVARKARHAALRTVAATAAALGIVLFIFAGQSRWIRNVFKGPFEISAAGLSTIKGVWNSPIYFVRVTGTDPVDMGVVLWNVETKNDVEVGRSAKAEYYSLVVGDKRLIVGTPKLGAVRDPVVIGALTGFPPGLRARLESELGRAALRRDYYPFYLKTGSIRAQGFLIVGVALLVAVGLFLVVRPSLRVLTTPDEHPLMDRIKSWGDPIQVSEAVEREWRMPPDLKFRYWKITGNYLVHSGPFVFDVFRFEDVLWAYQTVTHHSIPVLHVIPLIPIGSTLRTRLVCSKGTAVIRGRGKAAEALMPLVAERAPWAIFGYSPATRARFRKDPLAFREQIELNKRELRRR